MSVIGNSNMAVSHRKENVNADITDIFAPNREIESINDHLHTSPYAQSEIIHLDVGGPATRFSVHSWMLRKSAPLFAMASQEQPISLPKLDTGAAHTLVHYLYAGTFERKFRHLPAGKFRHSTCVYCASVQYQLSGLTELSKERIVEEGMGVPISDILKIARDEAFPLLPETDAWYSEYLEDVIQRAMAKDPEPFRRPDFITQVEGNSRLLQIVWKTVMSNYAVTSAPSSVKPSLASGAETPLAESMLTESEAPTQSSRHQLPSPTESVVDSPPTSRAADDLIDPQPLELDASAAAKPEHDPQARSNETDAEPAVDATSSDSPFNDDFGLPAIEPTTETSEALTTINLPPTKMKKPEHVRADSVVEPDAAIPDSNFDDAKRDSTSEAAPVTNNGNDTSKKHKKKNKKKSSIVF